MPAEMSLSSTDLAAKPDRLPPPGAGAPACLRGDRGRAVLLPDRVRVGRHGLVFSLLNIARHVEREIATTILPRDLAAAPLVRSLTLVQFLRFTYAGNPLPSGRHLRDAFAANAYRHSLRDNRPLLAFLRRTEAAAAAPRCRNVA